MTPTKGGWLDDALGLDGAGSPVAALPPAEAAVELARALHAVHALPVESCPFDASLAVEVPRVWSFVLGGLVDERRFNALLPYVPASEVLVVTHGQPTADRVLVGDGRLRGLLDPELLGVADRHRDLAVAAKTIEDHWGREHVAALFVAYGGDVDPGRLEFYRALDDLW